MKVFVLLTIVFTIFALGHCLKCYQCTQGQHIALRSFGELPECYFNDDDNICEDLDHCSTVIFDSNPESLTVMYTCASYLIEIPLPHNMIIKNCGLDFCNRGSQKVSTTNLTSVNVATSTLPTTILQNTYTKAAFGPIMTTPGTKPNGASFIIINTSLSFFLSLYVLSLNLLRNE